MTHSLRSNRNSRWVVELADELNKTDLVKGISKSTVGRLLRQVDIRPHKSRYWLTPNIKNKDEFHK